MNLRSAQGCAGRKKNGGTAVTGWGVRGTARRIAVESSRPDKARGPRSDLINLETRERRAPVRNSTPVAGLPPPLRTTTLPQPVLHSPAPSCLYGSRRLTTLSRFSNYLPHLFLLRPRLQHAARCRVSRTTVFLRHYRYSPLLSSPLPRSSGNRRMCRAKITGRVDADMQR